jgi:ribosome recycling factor
MLKAANILAVSPFDDSHKDAIVKAIEGSKLDVQISSEGNNIVVTLGQIPDDLKNESMQQCKKLQNKSKDEMKELRHKCASEIKKLEKILGKEEAHRIDKDLMALFEKVNKQIDQAYKNKEQEIKSG